MICKLSKTLNHFFFKLLLIIGLLTLSGPVFAASLYLSPSTQVVSVGNIVSVKILVNTSGKFINSADGVIQFPKEMLEVLSVNKGTILSLWVEEPKFSNYDGTISFNGGLPSPGFTGSNGEILTITLRAKKAGTASFLFGEASVRENDGLGTDVLTSKNPLNLKIEDIATSPKLADSVISTPKITTDANLPALPVISSPTHPKQDTWSKGQSATFSWTVPSDVISIQASLNKTSLSVPTVTYDASVSRKTLNGLKDGIYYFNLRQQNANGWSRTAHYKIKIDATAPLSFSPIVSHKNHQDLITLNATDETSGLDHYLLTIDNQSPISLAPADLEDNTYILPLQSKGNHVVNITAYDQAGNETEASESFTTTESSPPQLTLAADKIETGDTVLINGLSIYPKNKVIVFVRSNNGQIDKYEQITAADGSFKVITNNQKRTGLLTIVANMVLANGQLGPVSETVSLQVGDPKVIQVSKKFVYPIFGVATILFLSMLALLGLYMTWHHFFGLKKKLKSEADIMIESVHKTMLMFKKELNSQLRTLKRVKKDRILNEKEEEIFQQIQSNLDDVEKFIDQKIKGSKI